jgi:hypothetical protein
VKKWKTPRLWPGSNIAIIAGGPSFSKRKCEALRRSSLAGKVRVIGLNKAYKHISDANDWVHVIFFGDDIFYKIFRARSEDGIYTFDGLRVSCGSPKDDKAVKFLGRDRKKGHGISTDVRLVCWNKSTGGAAINLAYHFGGPGSNVFLFGYDMRRNGDGRGHWHNGYVEKNIKKDTFNVKLPFARFMSPFPKIAKDAQALKLNVFNVNTNSALNVFSKITLEEFLQKVNNEQ